MTKKVPAIAEMGKRGIKKVILINPEEQFNQGKVTTLKGNLGSKQLLKFMKPLMPMVKKNFERDQKFRKKLLKSLSKNVDIRLIVKDLIEK